MVSIVRYGFRHAGLGTEERSPDCPRKDVIEVQMELRQYANAGSAGTVDGHNRFETDLEVVPDPNHPGIDSARRPEARARIVGHRRRELCFHNGDQMIYESGELEIHDAGSEIRHAVLQR